MSATKPSDVSSDDVALRPEEASSLSRQTSLLMGKFFKQKRGKHATTACELLIPLYPTIVMFFLLQLDFMPYSYTETVAVTPTPIPLNNTGAEFWQAVSAGPAMFGVAAADDASWQVAERVCDRLDVDCALVSRFDTLDELRIATKVTGDSLVGSITVGLHVDAAASAFTVLHPSPKVQAAAATLIQDATLPPVEPEQIFVDGGYLRLQAEANEAMRGGSSSLLDMLVATFPVPEQRVIENVVKVLWPAMMASCFYVSMTSSLSSVGHEAERGIKEALHMKGMTAFPYYATWLVGQCAVIVVATVIMLIVSYILGVWEHAQFGLMFLAFALYGAGQTAATLAIAAAFGKKVTGKKLYGFAIMLMMLSSGTYYIVEYLMIDNDVGDFWVVLSFLVYWHPFSHILYRASDGELTGDGIRAEGLHNDYVVAAFVFMAIDVLLYFGLALLFEHLHAKADNAAAADADAPTDAARDEGIHVKDLCKEFKVVETAPNGCSKTVKELRAVDGVSFDVPAGQVFCLVGHNGAGKTTTIKTLVGSLEATSGEGWVGGLNIVKDRAQLRRSLGVCPQFDVVYDELSAVDQLVLYGGIAGLDDERAHKEARRLLRCLNLQDKGHRTAAQLSGGEKRRLSLATALIGAPRIILLDEATTGLDPNNRRNVWKLLSELKSGAHGPRTTILMTTHDMDEAEVLGDVIGVMSKGKMQALGTALDLKAQYGLGYQLLCVRADGHRAGDAGDADANALLELAKKHTPGAQLKSNIGAEVALHLPAGESSAFAALFDELDRTKDAFGIASFGLSASTLEDVFMELAKREEAEEKAKDAERKPSLDAHISSSGDGADGAAATGDHTAVTVGTGTADDGSDAGKSKATRTVDDVELPSVDDMDYKPTWGSQINALLKQAVLQAMRNPITSCYVILNPILMVVIVGIVSLAIQPDALEPVALLHGEALLADGSVAFAPESAASMLGGLAGTSEATAAALSAAVAADSEAALIDHEWSAPSITAAVSFSGDVPTSLTYNQRVEYSSAATLQQLYSGLDGVDGGSTPDASYLEMESTLARNLFSVGGLTGIVAIIFANVSAFYTEEIVRVRITRLKDMLLLAGLRRPAFWLAYFISHLLQLLFAMLFSLGLMAAFQMPGVLENNFFAYILLTLAFSVPAIFLGYLVGFAVNSIQSAQEMVGEMFNMSMMVPWVIVAFAMDEPNETLEAVLSIIPGFGLYRGFAVLEAAAKNGTPYSFADVVDWDKPLAPTMCVMAVTGVVMVLAVLAVDYGLLRRLRGVFKRGAPTQASSGKVENDDELGLGAMVSGELRDQTDVVVRVRGVKKSYHLPGRPPVRAVKGVSFDVPRNQIFGLLGPNGAGKTSTIHCLTHMEGEEMDSGDATVSGHSVVSDLENARVYMGICPQFDAQNDYLTGREHLNMLAGIRGVPPEKLKEVVDQYIEATDLTLKADAGTGTYSGGNRRRLSVAMSLIGKTRAVFLDEPSTGMDPVTRRHVWTFLEAARRDRAIVLTTHSMSEADALCQNIAIMVRGGIRTVGSAQALKNKHGQGYLVTVRALGAGFRAAEALEAAQAAQAAARGAAGGAGGAGAADAKEEKAGDAAAFDGAAADAADVHALMTSMGGVATGGSADVAKYAVRSATLAQVFGALNDARERLGIDDFRVTQATLEDVFISFARKQ